MARFHVNETGNPGVCRAAAGNCPFGGKEDHFPSAVLARQAFEEKMGGAWTVAAGHKLSKRSSMYLLGDIEPAAAPVLPQRIERFEAIDRSGVLLVKHLAKVRHEEHVRAMRELRRVAHSRGSVNTPTRRSKRELKASAELLAEGTADGSWTLPASVTASPQAAQRVSLFAELWLLGLHRLSRL